MSDLKPGFYIAEQANKRPGIVEWSGDQWRNKNDDRMFLKDESIEGIVFHHVDGRMCKITRRNFGMAWPC